MSSVETEHFINSGIIQEFKYLSAQQLRIMELLRWKPKKIISDTRKIIDGYYGVEI